MRVLIADKFETSGVEGLKALGCEVIYDPELKDQALADAIAAKGVDVLVVRSTKVGDPAMGGALKLIVRAGAGVNTIDVKAATAKKIVVANCPGKNAMAVAELALGLMLALDRRIAENVADLRAGKWNKKEYSKARGLYGQTLGVLGAGNIAAEVIKLMLQRSITVAGARILLLGMAYKANIDMTRESPFRVAIANANVPNMLGQISLAMGHGGLNIHNMVNKSRGDMAYTLVDVDSPAGDSVMAALKAIEGVLAVRYLPAP